MKDNILASTIKKGIFTLIMLVALIWVICIIALSQTAEPSPMDYLKLLPVNSHLTTHDTGDGLYHLSITYDFKDVSINYFTHKPLKVEEFASFILECNEKLKRYIE